MQTFINGYDISCCTLCPRECGKDRTMSYGTCGCDDKIRAARSALHHWEEPCISGSNGSGTIFFSGCSLCCCFCQNKEISHEGFGTEISIEKLGKCMLDLQEQGAHNINFVTGTHFTPWIIEAVKSVRDRLHIPLVWNSSGYETVKTIRSLKGIIDIYLPDFKYLSEAIAKEYSWAPDYPKYAEAAIMEMHRQVGAPVFDENGIMKRGLIVRHLILPGHRHESMAILQRLAEILPKDEFLISLMGQYTPPAEKLPYKNLNRRLTSMEYESVLKCAENLGLDGFSQELSSAQAYYTPEFDLEGLEND